MKLNQTKQRVFHLAITLLFFAAAAHGAPSPDPTARSPEARLDGKNADSQAEPRPNTSTASSSTDRSAEATTPERAKIVDPEPMSEEALLARYQGWVSGLSDAARRRWEVNDREGCVTLGGSWRVIGSSKGCLIHGKQNGLWVTASEKERLEEHLLDGEKSGPVRRLREEVLIESGHLLRGEREGRWRLFHAGGQPKEEIDYQAGVRSGTYRRWFENCRREEVGRYQEGKKDGLWRGWRERGGRAYEGRWVAGVREGRWRRFHKNNKLIEEGERRGDKREGPWHQWFASGQRWRTVKYIAGKLVDRDIERCIASKADWEIDWERREEGCRRFGSFSVGVKRIYYPNGKILGREVYVMNQRTGLYQRWHENGKELVTGQFEAGVPVGLFQYKGPNGEPWAQVLIHKGSGLWRSWNSDQQLIEEGLYHHAQLGRWRSWSDEGQLTEERFYDRHGNLDGPYQAWYANGQPRFKGEFESGGPSGFWRVFYSNGQLESAGFYADGQRSGQWSEYYWQSTLRQRGNYSEGRRSGEWAEFYENGEAKASGHYEGGRREGPWRRALYRGLNWRKERYQHGKRIDDDEAACSALKGSWVLDPKAREAGCQVCRVESPGEDEEISLLRTGRWQWWHENGGLQREGRFRFGEAEGLWRNYDLKGRLLSRQRFHAGRAEGEWEGYYSSGGLRFRGRFSRGEEVGLWRSLHPSGNVEAEGRFEAGLRVGRWRWRHGNGEIAQEGDFEAGRRSGRWRSWDETGHLQESGIYTEGGRDGLWCWWRRGERWRGALYDGGMQHPLDSTALPSDAACDGNDARALSEWLAAQQRTQPTPPRPGPRERGLIDGRAPEGTRPASTAVEPSGRAANPAAGPSLAEEPSPERRGSPE